MDKSYAIIYKVYEKIFDRCGLVYRAVEADSGAIGGNASHEFTALSEVGESEIAYCECCDMAATVERAACVDDVAGDEKEVFRVTLRRNDRLQLTFFRKTTCRRPTISLIHQQLASGGQQLPQHLYQLAAFRAIMGIAGRERKSS